MGDAESRCTAYLIDLPCNAAMSSALASMRADNALSLVSRVDASLVAGVVSSSRCQLSLDLMRELNC